MLFSIQLTEFNFSTQLEVKNRSASHQIPQIARNIYPTKNIAVKLPIQNSNNCNNPLKNLRNISYEHQNRLEKTRAHTLYKYFFALLFPMHKTLNQNNQNRQIYHHIGKVKYGKVKPFMPKNIVNHTAMHKSIKYI